MADPFEIKRDISTFDDTQINATPISETEATAKGVMVAALVSPEAGMDTQQDLMLTGESQDEQELLENAEVNRAIQDEEDIFEVLANDQMTQGQKRDIVNQIIQERAERRSMPLSTLFEEMTITKAKTETENEDLVQLGIAEHFEDLLEVNQEIRTANKDLTFNDSPLAIGRDFLMAAALPGWQFAVASVINQAVPGFVPDLTGRLAIGSTIAEFKAHVAQLPPRERLEVVRKVVKAIEENGFWGVDNGFMKFDLMHTLLGDLRDDTFDIVLNNIFSALDLLAVGELFRMGRAVARIGKIEPGITIKEFKTPEGKKQAFGTIRGSDGKIITNVRGTPREVKRILNRVARTENLTERKAKQSVASLLDNTAATESRVVSQQSLDDPTGTVAQASGASREQHTVDGILPKKPNDEVRVGPDLNDEADTLLDYDPSRIIDTPEELRTAESAMDLRLHAVRTLAPRVHLNKLEIEEVEGGFIGTTRVGDTQDRGFANLKSARGVASSFKNVNDVDTKILGRLYDEGEYVPLDELPKGPGINNEYLVEIKARHFVNPSDAVGSTESLLEGGRGLTGRIAGFFDKAASFQEWILRAGAVMADLESAKIDRLTAIMKPMTKLKNRDQAKVFSVLDEGDRFFDEATGVQGKWFTTDELLVRFGNELNAQELIEGYQSVVRHQRKIHKLINSATRRFLLAEDMKTVFLRKGRKQGEQKTLGKIVERSEIPTIKRIWDPDAGDVVDIDADALNLLAKQNNEFIRFRTPLFHKKEEVSFAINRTNTNTLQIRALPQEVVRSIPGYLSRIYDAPYILTRVIPNTRRDGIVRSGRTADGFAEEDKLVAVKVYTNKGDGIIERDRMNIEAENGERYVIKEATELRRDREYAQQTSLEYLENSGQLFTSRRGIELKGLDGGRELRPIQESIEVARARAARMGTRDLLVQKLIRNWEMKYGSRYSIDGSFPIANSGIVRKSQVLDDIDEFNDAVALQRHIKIVAGIDDTTMTRFFRDMIIWTADRLVSPIAGSAKNRLSASLLRNRHRNPLNAAKGLAFTKFIIFNPIRQIFLQSQQMTIYMGLDHGLKYFLSGRGIIDTQALHAGYLFRDSAMWDGMAETLSKGMRNVDGSQMSKADFTEFIDAFRRSGLPSSIDSHQYAALSNIDRNFADSTGDLLAGVNDTTDFFLKAVPRAGTRLISNPFNKVRRVARGLGFDFGERSQLAAAFAAVRNKWIKNNPTKAHLWAETDNLAEISADARLVSFNMNRTGTLQFQKGGIGVMMQFLSHATKSAQVLIPEKILGKTIPVMGKLSNKVFSGKEKARIALSQLAIYGTGAFGLNRFFEDAMAEAGVELPADVQTIIEEGTVGTIINGTLRALDPETESVFDLNRTEPVTDIEFSNNFATFSGIFTNPIARLSDSILLSDVSLLEFFAGPTYQVGTDITEAIQFTLAIRGHGVPAATTSEEGILIMDEWGRRFLPFYNNFIRGRAELAMDRHISNSGILGSESTEAEIKFRQFIGQTSRRQNQLQREMIDIAGLYGHPREDSMRTALDDTAKQYLKMAQRLSEQRADGKRTVAEITKITLDNAAGLKDVLDESEYDYIFNIRMPQLVYSSLSADGLEAKLVNTIVAGLNNRLPALEDESFIDGIRNHAPFEGQVELVELLEKLRSEP